MKAYDMTDLALERKISGQKNLKPAFKKSERIGNTVISEIVIENGEEKSNENYITIEQKGLWGRDGAELEELTDIISEKLKEMVKRVCGCEMNCDFSLLVAGLGNSEITADSIGPLTVKNLTVTRHLKSFEPRIYNELGSCEISAFSPGVLGQTGIESAELILGAVKTSAPDLLIAVDALAARSCERLASVVQISDAGIRPGSGIGNMRMEISKRSLGIPVISIGVPTVVNSSTLVYDVLRNAGMEQIDSDIERILESGRSFFVTPKESDIMSKKLSIIIAESIEKAFLIN